MHLDEEGIDDAEDAEDFLWVVASAAEGFVEEVEDLWGEDEA